MTVSSFYNGLISNMFMGGIAAILIIAAMFWKANKIAASGNKAKMFSWSVAPAIMVVIAVIAHGVALNIIWPKIQGAFTSTPVQNMVATGGALATAADGVLWGNGNGEMMASYAGPDAFKAPVMEASNGNVQAAPAAPLMEVLNSGEAAPVAAPANAPFQPLMGSEQPVAVPTLAPLQKVNMIGTTVTVLPGDSLAAIAKRAYGTTDGWRDIYAANRAAIGDNPNAIYAGLQLTIPAKGSQPINTVANVAAPAQPAQAPAAIAADGRVYYNVAIPTPVPAQVAVEAYQGHLQRVPVAVQPTATPVVMAPPTPAMIQVVSVKPGLDLMRPAVDTSAPGLGGSASTSGTTVTVGN